MVKWIKALGKTKPQVFLDNGKLRGFRHLFDQNCTQAMLAQKFVSSSEKPGVPPGVLAGADAGAVKHQMKLCVAR